jgi:hypothetical protein
MNDWITDRLPTAADADIDGEVLIKLVQDSECGEGAYAHFTVVVLGQPWWSRNAAARGAQPTPPPAPAPTRVVTAMTADGPCLYAACNDGTIWQFPGGLDRRWYQLPSIPQPETPND